jgi:hypothetical protein
VATFSTTAGPGSELFGATVERLIAETNGLKRLAMVDSDGVVRRAAPNDGRTSISPQLRREVQALLRPLVSTARPWGLASISEHPARVMA